MMGKDGARSSVDKEAAFNSGYVQRGFFNRVLISLLRVISDQDRLNDFDFYENTAMNLVHEGVYFTVRGHKSHISLEVGAEDDARKIVELLELVICEVLKEFNMGTWSCSLLVDCDDFFLSLNRIRFYQY